MRHTSFRLILKNKAFVVHFKKEIKKLFISSNILSIESISDTEDDRLGTREEYEKVLSDMKKVKTLQDTGRGDSRKNLDAIAKALEIRKSDLEKEIKKNPK